MFEVGEKTFISEEVKALIEDKIIRSSEHDLEFIQMLIAFGGKGFQTCFQCGNCTGVCPISLKSPMYNTRNLMKLCQLGLKNRVLSDYWVCATCHRCKERCPAGITPAEVMIALRHIAVRERGAPAHIRRVAMNVLRYGQSIKPDYDIQMFRERLGHKSIPGEKKAKEKMIHEGKQIMAYTKYDKLMGMAQIPED